MTQAAFDALALPTDWKKQVLADSVIEKLNLPRPSDQIAVVASGCMSDPRAMHGHPAIAGFDVLTYESRPKKAKNEPAGNAYHFIVIKSGRSDCPYIQIGPFDDGACISHWFDSPELDNYISSLPED